MDIAGLYEKSLEFPAEKPDKQFILCPVGLVGAGKTTVVKPLAKKLNLVRISSDEVRKILKDNGQGYEKLGDILTMIGKKLIEQGYSLALDMDCAGENGTNMIKKAEDTYHIQSIWVHINPPEEFILNNLSNRQTPWLGTVEEMVANYHARKSLHEHLDFPFVYTFDTSRSDLDDQIEEAVRIIRSKV